MKEKNTDTMELTELCTAVHALADRGGYDQAARLLYEAMGQYPDRAEPHNLLGLLLERQGSHADAMRHFRAAWALDPTYEPAQKNLEVFGAFPRTGFPVWQRAECPVKRHFPCILAYGGRGFGTVVKTAV